MQALMGLYGGKALFNTEKEVDVVKNMLSYHKKTGKLSVRQVRYYEHIANKYTQDKLDIETGWVDSYDSDKRLTATRIARYYINNPPYFHVLASSILEDPNFIVPSRAWEKFCNNKYAKKILNQYEQEDKFSKGDSIQIRGKNRVHRANYGKATYYSHEVKRYERSLANKPGIVLAANCLPITEAFKGSKVYRVLLHGQIKPIYAYESDLKKARFSKK
tara:strand:- start:3880 stop:4533 length:654 start_codon:yes stop_codon:yes gene_type:complete